MNQEMVRLSPDRPAFLQAGGVRVYVAVHDESYRIRKSAFKEKIRLLHPDLEHRTCVAYVPAQLVEVPATQVTRLGKTYQRKAYTQPVPERLWVAKRSCSIEFRRVVQAYKRFLAEEREWYAQYGLDVPRG